MSNQLTEIGKSIKKEKESLSSTILKRQESKYQRDNITIFEHPRKIEDLESQSEGIKIIIRSYYIAKKSEKLLKKFKQHVQIRTLPTSYYQLILNSLVRQLGNPLIEAKSAIVNFWEKKKYVSSLELFIELVEKDLSKPSSHNKIKGNIITKSS